MEAADSSKTFISTYQTMWCCDLEDHNVILKSFSQFKMPKNSILLFQFLVTTGIPQILKTYGFLKVFIMHTQLIKLLIIKGYICPESATLPSNAPPHGKAAHTNYMVQKYI
jgi:hypothetical protein